MNCQPYIAEQQIFSPNNEGFLPVLDIALVRRPIQPRETIKRFLTFLNLQEYIEKLKIRQIVRIGDQRQL